MWTNICHYIFSSLLSKIETSVLLRGTFYGLIRLLFLIIFLRYFCIELTLLLSYNQIDTKVVISIKYGWNTLSKKSNIWDIIHTRIMSQMGTKLGHKNYGGTNLHRKFFGIYHNLGHNILVLYNVSLQVRVATSKTKLISSINLVHELPNNLKLMILANLGILENSEIWLET